MGTADPIRTNQVDVTAGDRPDRALLEQFVSSRNEAAFAELVQRYGPLVYAVCRRVLRHEQDAQDASQAAFLILARKAGSIRGRASLAGWLYRVAYRIALKAKQRRLRLQVREHELEDLPEPERSPTWLWEDVRALLDDEVSRLSPKYRLPFVLCHLQGMTNEQAARELGCPLGTVLSRLARARERLRHRLSRRGLALTTAALAAVLSEHVLAAGFPAGLSTPTAGAAVLFVGGQTAGVGAIAPGVRALAEGFLRTLVLARLKWAGAALGALALLAVFLLLPFLRPSVKQAGILPAAADGPPDTERFQGTWRFVDLEMAGRKVPRENAQLVFHEDKCDLVFAGGEKLPMSFKLDQTSQPKRIDLEFVLDTRKLIDRGIYEFDGDFLRICYSPARRPTEFISHTDSDETYCLLERDKTAPSKSNPRDSGP